MSDSSFWTQAEAIALCIKVEDLLAKRGDIGCHVALTGGCLYHPDRRKDCDLLFYRVRQVECIDKDALFDALETIGLVEFKGQGWCHKATYQGKLVDMFFPEEDHIEGEEEYKP